MKPNPRNALLVALAAVVAAYLFFKADSFWGVICSGLIGVWAVFYALQLLDGGWRMRVGLMVTTMIGATIVLWPTLTSMSDGKLPCPQYIRENVTKRIV